VTSSKQNKRRDQNFEKVSDSSTTSVFNGANLHFFKSFKQAFDGKKTKKDCFLNDKHFLRTPNCKNETEIDEKHDTEPLQTQI
jgi:uncharacterized protein YktA (UPF0223 family)